MPPDEREKTPAFGSMIEPARLVAWLGASAGGLGILLGVVGFLAQGAHDMMLGIPRMLHDKLEYIIVGFLLFSRSLIYMLAALLAFPPTGVVLAILLAVLGIHHFVAGRYPTGRRIGLHVAAVGLIFAELYALWRLAVPLQFAHILVEDVEGSASPVLKAIRNNDVTCLQYEYGFLAVLVLSLAIVLRRQERGYRDRGHSPANNTSSCVKWLHIPSVALFILCSVLLPLAYGVLTLSNEFPQILDLTPSAAVTMEPQNDPVFLLREDEKTLVLYAPSTRSLITLERASLVSYRVSAPKPIFKPGGQNHDQKSGQNSCAGFLGFARSSHSFA